MMNVVSKAGIYPNAIPEITVEENSLVIRYALAEVEASCHPSSTGKTSGFTSAAGKVRIGDNTFAVNPKWIDVAVLA